MATVGGRRADAKRGGCVGDISGVGMCRRRMAERVRHVGTLHPGGRLRWGGVKEFSDGSLGSHTALMHEPYAGECKCFMRTAC